MYLLLKAQEVFFLVHVVLDVCLAVPGLFGCSAFPGEVSRFIAIITLPDMRGWALARSFL